MKEKVYLVPEVVSESNAKITLTDSSKSKTTNQTTDYFFKNSPLKENVGATTQQTVSLFRLFVKNGEYVYARPNDIILMESCDHLVKVYLAFNDKIKKTIRHNTLKDFLFNLPNDQFVRIGRFCAINLHRVSGGNYHEQTIEFDFKISIKLQHAISHACFTDIGK